MDETKIKPFLKWAGGKYRVVDFLKSKFPTQATRYLEPFLGAGSVALNVDYPQIIVNDVNPDLVSVWGEFKNLGMEFVDECRKLFISVNNTKERYDELRDEFNHTADSFRKAVLFVYLNRHCFNGLCRYNSRGEFNTPVGSYTEPYFPQQEFEACLEQVKKFEIYNKDFREVFQMVQEGDLVYCDPPYLPLSQSANFDTYSEGGFSLKDQIELAECAEKAASNGAIVVISNHYNWYSKQLYTKVFNGKISKLDVKRTISAKTSKRDAVGEIVAVFSKEL